MIFPLNFSTENTKPSMLEQELISQEWDLLNREQAIRLYTIRCEFEMEREPDNEFATKYLSASIRDFENLQYLDTYFDAQEFYEHNPDWQYDFEGDIIYKDNNSDKTIVVLSHNGHWATSVYNKVKLENNIHPEFNWLSKDNNYNFVSFMERESRNYENPMTSFSGLYKGINDVINSPEKISEWIKKKFPNTSYNIVSDCKTGHSSCLVGHYLKADKVFLCAPSTYFDKQLLKKRFMKDEGKVSIDCLGNIDFILYVRSILHSHKYKNLLSINDIAKQNTNTIYNINYCKNDEIMEWHWKHVDNTLDNIIFNIRKPDSWTKNNHHIINSVRKKKLIQEFFNFQASSNCSA